MTRRGGSFPGRSVVAVACVLLGAAGCTSDAGTEGTDGVEGADGAGRVAVEVGQVEEVPRTAVETDAGAEVALPSGVLSLEVAPELAEVTTDEGELVPAEDATLVGLTWTFEAHPSSDARDVLLDGEPPSSLPQPTVSLLDGSTEVELPVPASAGASGGVVLGASDPVGLEVSFDGLTQTVDLTTGAVGAGPAEGLRDLDAATTVLRASCPAADLPPAATLDHGCRVEQVHRVPYVVGLGWAEDAQTWLVVDARIRGGATLRLGDDEGTTLGSAPPGVERVAWPAAVDSPQTVDVDFGPAVGVVSVPLGR